ncbi:LAFE_0B06964g1_1 [Lachancea fermentati]|uniref:LAFE_0B06964g1_1 n=1 Tax=Lachancea fermentati TaxID=4955 RepID=A0A1G4M8A6_LACFM|nr:LAFE_0B06964g1_1 [Lachancea fermentati]
MKLLKDLTISRKEFADWTRNLVWSRDGTLFLTTYPELTVCLPVYNKQIGRSSKDLFHVKEYPLSLPNKIEYELTEENTMLNSQPESFVKLCKPSPVDDLLAIMTNNGNVCVFRERRLIVEIDEPKKSLKKRTYHSMAWSPDGNFFAVGNEDGDLVIFSVSRSSDKVDFSLKTAINLDENNSEWVLGIEWSQNAIVVHLSDNSVHVVKQDFSFMKVKESSRFRVTDVRVINNDAFITSTGFLHKISLKDNFSTFVEVGICDEFYILPVKSQNAAVLISNKTSYMVDLEKEMTIHTDSIISPHLEGKFKKWNNVFNEFNKYETNLFIYGLAVSPDEASVAILYNIDRVSIRYRIASELQYRICFIPLNEKWFISQETTGLAWYQNFHIYDSRLPEDSNINSYTEQLDADVDFELFLRRLLKDNDINKSRFLNFVNDRKENNKYREAIFRYAEQNKDAIDNPLDKACVQSLANILKKPSPIHSEVVLIKSDFISETFRFDNNFDPEIITSEEGHTWRRCSVTLLPLLTTKVKICPVSAQRIINIRQDIHNDYGWFTGTILKVLNNESIYSGTKMLNAE